MRCCQEAVTTTRAIFSATKTRSEKSHRSMHRSAAPSTPPPLGTPLDCSVLKIRRVRAVRWKEGIASSSGKRRTTSCFGSLLGATKSTTCLLPHHVCTPVCLENRTVSWPRCSFWHHEYLRYHVLLLYLSQLEHRDCSSCHSFSTDGLGTLVPPIRPSPMILVVFGHVKAQKEILAFIQSTFLPDRLTILVYLVSRKHRYFRHFPVNYLRNLGIRNVRTSHYIVMDMDMWSLSRHFSLLWNQQMLTMSCIKYQIR